MRLKCLITLTALVSISWVCTAPVEDEQNFINPLMLTKHAKQTSEVIEDAESNKMVGLIREDPESEEDDDDDDEDMSDELSGELFQYQADDDAWNSIELNNTLDSDDYYDYNNITRLLEDDDDVNMIPSFRSIQDAVTPSLYTKENPEEPFELTTVNGRDSPISINHPTKVIVHGWLENGGKMWLLRMKDKYLINGNHNVITLDWEKWATTEYTISARKTRKIGAYLGQVLMTLIASEKIRPEDIHITGHSLGAHVAGIAAKTIKAQTGHKIGRITGLDPAGPGFEFPLKAKASKRLDKNDAMFVDVIHTCSGILGVKRQYGHADFYPNDGKNIQPGCGVIKNMVCSHSRAYSYYTESINSKNFVATQCKSWRKFRRGKCKKGETVLMGYHLDTSKAAGKYYLRTKKRAPYAKG